MSFRVINGKTYVVGQEFANEGINKQVNPNSASSNEVFKNILDEKISKDSLKVSAHAMERIGNLDINNKDLEKISEAFKKARDKGCENSVIFYKDVAFIGSIKNNTLITAVEKERAKENVFTNIDSVIIL